MSIQGPSDLERANARILLERVLGAPPTEDGTVNEASQTAAKKPPRTWTKEEWDDAGWVARTLEESLTRRRRRPDAEMHAMTAILAELDTKWRIPPTAMAKAMAQEVATSLAMNPEFMTTLAKAIAQEVTKNLATPSSGG